MLFLLCLAVMDAQCISYCGKSVELSLVSLLFKSVWLTLFDSTIRLRIFSIFTFDKYINTT